MIMLQITIICISKWPKWLSSTFIHFLPEERFSSGHFLPWKLPVSSALGRKSTTLTFIIPCIGNWIHLIDGWGTGHSSAWSESIVKIVLFCISFSILLVIRLYIRLHTGNPDYFSHLSSHSNWPNFSFPGLLWFVLILWGPIWRNAKYGKVSLTRNLQIISRLRSTHSIFEPQNHFSWCTILLPSFTFFFLAKVPIFSKKDSSFLSFLKVACIGDAIFLCCEMVLWPTLWKSWRVLQGAPDGIQRIQIWRETVETSDYWPRWVGAYGELPVGKW